MFTSGIPKAARRGLLASFALFALALAGCGGGGSSGGGSVAAAPTPTSGCEGSGCGTMLLSITDADGDFLSYTVDVVSLSLRRADGTRVEALPVRQRIDFAGLVDLRELVTAATVPGGSYVQGTVRLDFSNAEISVDVGGTPKKAVAVDGSGRALGVLDLDVRLDDRNRLVIAPGRPALLDLDFDLAASNTVDLGRDPVQVTVQPFMVASLELADSRELRARGPLVAVDVAGSAYSIELRPFHHATARLGEARVYTTAQTVFEIDGTTYTGTPGLEALARLPAGSPTAAFGTLVPAERRFTAARVHAGTSVEGPRFDVIEGNVIARSGGRLTVRGVTVVRRSGEVQFRREDAMLLVGSTTRVLRDGQRGDDLGIAALSVGQRIHAFGTASEDAAGALTLDAREGRVRMHLTHLLGLVRTAQPGALALELNAIDRHRASVFSFAGTGASTAQDADPRNYEVATGALDLGRLAPGAAVRAFGFVTPFGTAPPDFEARSIVDYQEALAVLSIGWGLAGTSAPFLSIDGSGIVVDNHDPAIGARHFIAIGPRLIDIRTLARPPRVVSDPALRGTFAIAERSGSSSEPRSITMYEDFSTFAAKLGEKLSGGAKIAGLTATGRYDAGTGDFSSQRVLAELAGS